MNERLENLLTYKTIRRALAAGPQSLPFVVGNQSFWANGDLVFNGNKEGFFLPYGDAVDVDTTMGLILAISKEPLVGVFPRETGKIFSDGIANARTTPFARGTVAHSAASISRLLPPPDGPSTLCRLAYTPFQSTKQSPTLFGLDNDHIENVKNLIKLRTPPIAQQLLMNVTMMAQLALFENPQVKDANDIEQKLLNRLADSYVEVIMGFLNDDSPDLSIETLDKHIIPAAEGFAQKFMEEYDWLKEFFAKHAGKTFDAMLKEAAVKLFYSLYKTHPSSQVAAGFLGGSSAWTLDVFAEPNLNWERAESNAGLHHALGGYALAERMLAGACQGAAMQLMSSSETLKCKDTGTYHASLWPEGSLAEAAVKAVRASDGAELPDEVGYIVGIGDVMASLRTQIDLRMVNTLLSGAIYSLTEISMVVGDRTPEIRQALSNAMFARDLFFEVCRFVAMQHDDGVKAERRIFTEAVVNGIKEAN